VTVHAIYIDFFSSEELGGNFPAINGQYDMAKHLGKCAYVFHTGSLDKSFEILKF